jgi:hypothetical protein
VRRAAFCILGSYRAFAAICAKGGRPRGRYETVAPDRPHKAGRARASCGIL